jgi:hypothetical protein
VEAQPDQALTMCVRDLVRGSMKGLMSAHTDENHTGVLMMKMCAARSG